MAPPGEGECSIIAPLGDGECSTIAADGEGDTPAEEPAEEPPPLLEPQPATTTAPAMVSMISAETTFESLIGYLPGFESYSKEVSIGAARYGWVTRGTPAPRGASGRPARGPALGRVHVTQR